MLPAKTGTSAEGPTLILPDLSFDDEGVYECEAYNSEGRETYQGRISVQGNNLIWFWHLNRDTFKGPDSLKASSCSSSAAVAAGDERLGSGDQLRADLELHRCWQTQTLHSLASQWTANWHTGRTAEMDSLQIFGASVQTSI